jgi:putative membrane protein
VLNVGLIHGKTCLPVNRLPKILILGPWIYLCVWIWAAFGVDDRLTWILENTLVVLLGWPLFKLFRADYISDRSRWGILVFLLCHVIGAHYTYSLVPYKSWLEFIHLDGLSQLLGERNHYDRLVHFLWGFCFLRPFMERIRYKYKTSWKKSFWISALIIFSLETIYELLEWAAAEAFGGESGLAFVGSQGDIWDAQKDQFLAICGIFFATGVWFRRKEL